ncbi:probable E3 ubiquitin-protein ligase ZFP1 [Olea europaea var. sylvestris]|uniref:probable E3 ubiquitin-protein ligase ZFP1 n=1 Tax=Olea europaea var. sylvestris TaxID=158386 RepID=UPI000C1CFAC1|nr:probable E3 ubiquitin-protein ligase ZFP1 [Olea europaea var. sylvestris]
MNGCFFTQVQACDVILPASHFSEFLTFCWLQELLVLEEQIGIVGTGLSEEDIQNSLKTRTFSSLATCLNQKKAATVEQQSNFCVICQADFEDQENVGNLNCGHEYHEDCIKKWLLIKNSCPICKSTALTTVKKNCK